MLGQEERGILKVDKEEKRSRNLYKNRKRVYVKGIYSEENCRRTRH